MKNELTLGDYGIEEGDEIDVLPDFSTFDASWETDA